MSKALGYPTRTAAAIALQGQGYGNRQIAEALNISVSTVSALLASGYRAKKRGGTGAPSERGKYGMGTAQLEARIMDLYDAGSRQGEIAKALNIRPETVGKVVGYMSEGATDLAFGRCAAVRASASLLAAIQRHHPERCGQ
ncbi:response regulator transcription factor [Sphingobium sp. TB-6]|uniref:response regulator transcription factor n=1 Tax=Sphingobium sp. TB-6 TaxID=2728850 RepID=UPI00146ADDA9|nr:response regulator transcription factor [Sphingobium sp. TB-6]NML88379.1 response regulator transcription factor [Sphingobium sp. TB-6]